MGWADRHGPEATVTTGWKTAICKWGVLKRDNLKCPVSYVLNFRGWIKLIYDKITLIYCVKSVFNPTSEVQNIENGDDSECIFVITEVYVTTFISNLCWLEEVNFLWHTSVHMDGWTHRHSCRNSDSDFHVNLRTHKRKTYISYQNQQVLFLFDVEHLMCNLFHSQRPQQKRKTIV